MVLAATFANVTKRVSILIPNLISTGNDYQLSPIEILEQALNGLREEKGLKLEDVSIRRIDKKIVEGKEKAIAIVRTPDSLKLDPRNRNYDSVRYLHKLMELKLLNSGAGIQDVEIESNEFLPWSKLDAYADREIALRLENEHKIKK